MSDWINRAGWSLVGGVLLTVLLGAVLDLKGAFDQAQRPERPAEASVLVGQPPHYTGPSWCLVEGTGQPESCRGELPECAAEDGSGPETWCFWTDPDTGDIWFNDGDESNDHQKLP